MTSPEPSWTRELDRAVEERAGRLVEIRRHLHRNPEPSGQEVNTTRYLARTMEELGLEPWIGKDGCGLAVEGPAPRDLPRIALRGDMDALRIQEAGDCEYRSRVPGVMHACGHDAHASCIAGCAMALVALERAGALPWPVPWKAVFQPSEEEATGALSLIRQGVLENVRSIFSLHMDPGRPVGGLAMRDGAFTSACDEFSIEVEGRGGHGSRPQDSRDALLAAATLIAGIYQHLPRRSDPLRPVVATIGSVSAGEDANSIPASALIRGMLRAAGESCREKLRRDLQELVGGMEALTGCRHRLAFPAGCPSVRNSPRLNRVLLQAAASMPQDLEVEWLPDPSMGGEDFGEYTVRVPGCMFRLGCRTRPPGGLLHSPRFDLDERSLGLGVGLLVRAAVLEADPDRPEAPPDDDGKAQVRLQ